MEKYTHDMHYDLPVKPSPNLPNARSVNLYPSLCLFEGTNISIGRGTKYPFQHFGFLIYKVVISLSKKWEQGSKHPKHENKTCFGFDLRNQDNYFTSINLDWLIYCYKNSNNKDIFFNNFFDKLVGTNQLRLQIIQGKNSKEIKSSWKLDLEEFKKIRQKYLLY